MPTRSSPEAQAWQVSSTKPGPKSPTASQSRPSRSNVRAIAFSPPAVFSMRIGSPKPPSGARSNVLRQFSTPSSGSSFAVTWPPCTIRPFAPIAAAAAACWASILRLGMRILLFVLATFTR